MYFSSFFFNDTATTEIYTLSLHDALPISTERSEAVVCGGSQHSPALFCRQDRKSTRLNSSHMSISYAVFCLKKKKNNRYLWISFQSNHDCSRRVGRQMRSSMSRH